MWLNVMQSRLDYAATIPHLFHLLLHVIFGLSRYPTSVMTVKPIFCIFLMYTSGKGFVTLSRRALWGCLGVFRPR